MKKVTIGSLKTKTVNKPSIKQTVEKYGGVYKEELDDSNVTIIDNDIYVNGKLIGSKG